MNIHLHIDRLVLDGLDVPFGSRDVLRAAVEQELTHLISAGGLARSIAGGVALPSAGAPPIVATGAPAHLGRAIAGSVYGAVGDGAPQVTTAKRAR